MNTQTGRIAKLNLSTTHKVFLVILRMAIGWHFLYEGVVKLFNPNWSSAAYLAEAKWIFSGIFHGIVDNQGVLQVVDFMNIWGLILIGLGLILGTFTRLASAAGILLLGLYYVANPPFISYAPGMPTEGNYLFVDKNLIELIALIILVLFPTGRFFGLDTLLGTVTGKIKAVVRRIISKPGAAPVEPLPASAGRREIIKGLTTLPFLGAFALAYGKKRAWESYEERHLMSAAQDDLNAVTSATIKTFHFSSLKDLKGTLPSGQIGPLKLSRLFLGGNLIGGWAHARDLIYVSKLIKVYHSDQKVFDTFRLAEQCGINTILTNPQLSRVINAYWRKENGKIQFISDCAYEGDVIEGIKMSIDGGAHACYVQGGISDQLVQEGKTEEIGRALDLIKQNGLPAGIGAHQLETVQACVDFALKPDFWVKTLHHCNYWSARPKEQNDNIWCLNPEETIAYMNQLEEPWIAFKILAAGAIHPTEGFPYAFKNGADFICVGMYDFQIVDDVNIALEVLNGNLYRERPWRA